MKRYFERRWLALLQNVIDVVGLSAAYFVAFLLRYEFRLPPFGRTRIALTLPYVVALEMAALSLTGFLLVSWRFISLSATRRAVQAMVAAGALLVASRFASGVLSRHYGTFALFMVPYGVIVMNVAFAFLFVLGVRVLRRALAEREESAHRVRPSLPEISEKLTLLIGAGAAGALVARELRHRPDLGVTPVGFLDDDVTKLGSIIEDLPVVGTTSQIVELSKKHGIDQVLVTIAGPSASAVRAVLERCSENGIEAKILPGLYEIVTGQVALDRIRPVAIEDLLQRDPISLDRASMDASYRGKRVLITGAGGSIGSELCRQIAAFEPATLFLLEQAENPLFHIERELRQAFPALRVLPIIADVTDSNRVRRVFEELRPHVVIHAAAHKHVPLMEANPGEAIKNNVFGTKAVADASHACEAEAFVLISTDKAVNPTSVMGASKRAAELYVQSLAQSSKTKYVAVRFGNVLGSAGSVVPIFQEQIRRGGPVTVTHPEMRRYFMTIPEATQLVLQAGALGAGGEIFVLDMGEPVRIADLARDLIRLSGFRPELDIRVEFTGMRPGEKLFEELATTEEQAEKTRHPKIFIGRVAQRPAEVVHEWLGALSGVAHEGRHGNVVDALRELIPEFTPDRPSS